jgi:3-methyl-2-oxobutanoate hydroxymethyltransferase
MPKKMVVLTAYDYQTAGVLEASGVDMILVGDSLGMVVLGYDSTTRVTMDEMIHHAKAVRRGAPKTHVIGDLPLKGIVKGPAQTLVSSRRFLKEAGCDSVKIEWGKHAIRSTELLVSKKIKVLGHVGLTPQTAAKTGGFKTRGRHAAAAVEIFEQALAFQRAGAFAVILESVPAELGQVITRALRIPTIGIGAGPDCSGQVLVLNDVVGLFTNFKPRFVKRYVELDAEMKKAVGRYAADVRAGRFPAAENVSRMEPAERAKLEEALSAFRKSKG